METANNNAIKDDKETGSPRAIVDSRGFLIAFSRK